VCGSRISTREGRYETCFGQLESSLWFRCITVRGSYLSVACFVASGVGELRDRAWFRGPLVVYSDPLLVHSGVPLEWRLPSTMSLYSYSYSWNSGECRKPLPIWSGRFRSRILRGVQVDHGWVASPDQVNHGWVASWLTHLPRRNERVEGELHQICPGVTSELQAIGPLLAHE